MLKKTKTRIVKHNDEFAVRFCYLSTPNFNAIIAG